VPDQCRRRDERTIEARGRALRASCVYRLGMGATLPRYAPGAIWKRPSTIFAFPVSCLPEITLTVASVWLAT
jgi:hypothetical protein